MSDGPLLNDVTRAFAETHRNEDVRDLALKTKRTADLDLPAALDQIAGWQIARNKLPQWAACADIVYPAHISMEQCSSQFTAQYKAEIARRLLRSLPQSAGQTANDATMTDLTGGFGVDFSYLAREFGHATYVERQSHLCELAAHNMAALGLTQAQVVCGDGVEYLRAMEPAQLIYIDPARRDEHGARTYAIEDCTPDVLALRDLLLAKAPLPHELRYLYEPNASIMKAGCFDVVEARFGAVQIGPNSHLFVSDEPVDGFPGRGFAIETIGGMCKKELKRLLSGLDRANIAVRNFPLTAPQLRKKLKLADGGDAYLFGTTMQGGDHVLIRTAKISR